MKPNNKLPESCTPISSRCVIWDGPDITCIDICNGDSVSDVVYALAKELCEVLEQVNISNYDLKCLPFENCKPVDFKAMIQLIIKQLCFVPGAPFADPSALGTGEVSASSSFASTSDGCPNCLVALAPCFQYNNPSTGDIVTQGLLADYVQLIGLRICSILNQVATQQSALVNFSERMLIQEQRTFPAYVLPNLFPVCVANPLQSIPLDTLAALTEAKVCEMLTAVGTPSAIFTAISAGSLLTIGAQDALGTTGGKVAALPGWVPDVKTLLESLQNAYTLILDLRSAVANLLATCCSSSCSALSISFTAAMSGASFIKLFFSGSIPANFTNCLAQGSSFSIQDQHGNSIIQTVNVVGNMNNAGGVSINLSGTPLDLADDLLVTSTMCFTDNDTESVCERYTSYTIVNSLTCPVVTYTPNSTTLAYNFIHVGGSLTYSIQVYDNSNILVQQQSVAVSGNTPVSGSFSGLDPNTLYKVRLHMNTGTQLKDCPFTLVITSVDTCPAPQNVTTIFSIP